MKQVARFSAMLFFFTVGFLHDSAALAQNQQDASDAIDLIEAKKSEASMAKNYASGQSDIIVALRWEASQRLSTFQGDPAVLAEATNFCAAAENFMNAGVARWVAGDLHYGFGVDALEAMHAEYRGQAWQNVMGLFDPTHLNFVISINEFHHAVAEYQTSQSLYALAIEILTTPPPM